MMDLWPAYTQRLDQILANQDHIMATQNLILRWLHVLHTQGLKLMSTAAEMQAAQVQLFADIETWRAANAAQIAALQAIVPTTDTAATQAAIDAVTAGLVAEDAKFHPALATAATVVGAPPPAPPPAA